MSSSVRGASIFIPAIALAILALTGCSEDPIDPVGRTIATPPQSLARPESEDLPWLVLGYNDLGMHCMNQSFAEFMILPPFNTLHAQVIEPREEHAVLVTEGVQVTYEIPGNTVSCTKTDFWEHVESLLGAQLPPDIGLTGHGLTGALEPSGAGDWLVTGIPLTPVCDDGREDPFQLATVSVEREGELLARTRTVVPVSWELSCQLCHHGAPDAPVSVLDAHDRLHGTSLYHPEDQSPVLCGGCHAQPELGLAGDPARRNLSSAIHGAHASRMMDVVGSVPKGVVCFACHPGPSTPCLRDVHARAQMTCMSCHSPGQRDPEAAMLAVADPARSPWADLPRCDGCHHRAGYEYEQAGTLFRNSIGHGGVFCEGCHNSTHAIVPALDAPDNVQSVMVQNHPGSIRKCTACHGRRPAGMFRHRYVAAAPEG